jgi:hypothetical protein
MHIDRTYPVPGKTDTHIRVYNCRACGHEMRLTMWTSDTTSSLSTDATSTRGDRREALSVSPVAVVNPFDGFLTLTSDYSLGGRD